jgi:hypothetical protein
MSASYPSPFATLSCVDGFDVILEDSGRAVGHRPNLRSANGVAQMLNGIARSRGLEAALSEVGIRTTTFAAARARKWDEGVGSGTNVGGTIWL